MSTRWGQVVLGPPGCGKTTYCKAMAEFMRALGRTVAVVNMDPANDSLPYDCDVDLSDLVTVEDVMDKLNLGPNGGLIYCMEYLEENLDWLESRIKALPPKAYLLFDCPGQIELYTHHSSLRNILARFVKLDYRLASVHLVDSHYCSDPGKYISVVLTSLATMLQVELPHVNLLSKVDLIEQYGKLTFNIDYYTEVLDLQYMVDQFKDDPFFVKYKKLNSALAGVIEDYSLVSFIPLTVQDKAIMANVLKAIDKANGCVLGSLGENGDVYLSDAQLVWDKVGSVRDKYMHVDEDDRDSGDSSDT